MKKVYLFAALSAMLTACTQTEEQNPLSETTAMAPSAINFDVYTSRATRAGTFGEIDDAALKDATLADIDFKGFGIFAYYTEAGNYDEYCKPNFMYNQQVKWDGTSKWVYEPVKYWPNEYGNAAASDDVDRISFFAYAPYVKVIPSTGAIDQTATASNPDYLDQTKGITSLTKNTATGDPLVKYVVNLDPAKQVDLLWGTADPANDVTVNDYAGTSISKGMPFIDIVKQKDADQDKLKFFFQHALAALNVTIDAYADDTYSGSSTEIETTKTKIYVRSITFSGFALKGALNLNNTTSNTPKWLDYGGADELTTGSITIYDGRKDGKEGTAEGTASNETVTGLNAQIIQNSTATNGVTKTTQYNLFNHATTTQPIYVIPSSDNVDVTIVYDVETEDDNLAGYLSDGVTHGSTIENKITKTNIFTGALAAGKTYTLNLHLGMTSVKFDAEVYATFASGGTGNVELPKND